MVQLSQPEVPKEIRAMYNLGAECVEPAVVSIQPEDNKIAANETSPNNF
jgi:hypothetical protein